MHIEKIDTVERLFEIELDWDELYRLDPAGHIYLSSRFISAIAIRSAGQFRILTARSDDGRLIGLLPLLVTTRWSKGAACLYNVLDMLGHAFDADYTGILCDPSHAEQVCHVFGQTVTKMPMGRVILNFFDGPSERLQAFLSAFDPALYDQRANEHLINDGQTNNLVCPYIDLPSSFAHYLETLSTNSRQKIRRLLRQLEQDQGLKITRSRPETYQQDVTILSKLWFLQYAERKGQKRADRLAELFKEVVMLGLAAGIVHLAILWRDGKPVAAQANYIDPVKKQSLFHVGGRDERIQDLSSGLLLQAYCIRWAISQGLALYDFTIGDEPYKYSLGAADRQIMSAEVNTRSGANNSDMLDPACRADVMKHLQTFITKGRGKDAHTVLEQAVVVWPDFMDAPDVKSLVKNLT